MSLKETCIVALKQGAWTFSVLGPQFRSALIKRVQGGNPALSVHDRSLMELTLLGYRGNIPTGDRVQSTKRMIDPAVQSKPVQISLQLLAEATVDGSEVSAFTPLEEERIRSASEQIARLAPAMAKEYHQWITHFLKLEGVPFRSASHPHAFGCIFLSSRIAAMTPVELATSLVHEMGHQDLFLLNIIDRLIQKEADYKLAHAPFQGTCRPPIGRLHSYFALYRMIQFQHQAGLDTRNYRRLFSETKGSFAEDELTEYGFQIVEAAFDFVEKHSPPMEHRFA
ncbi:MAG: HEXXH motif-containing putative peptide modification protein [Bdellovibrionales bacterium]